MFSKTLDVKDVRCDVRFDGMTADWVVGGELRIGQVVINFLSNAVKFTSQGEVTVTFRQMLLREGTLDLMLRVHDTGIGMDPEFINRIFRPFEQEDASTTRRFGGTGLGMAISDQLVRLMGGQIVVESMKGQGSDFSVILSLPVADEAQAAQAEAAPAPQKLSCRVLMAEDNEINAMITVEILGQKGVTLDVAENGQAAVERFSSQTPGTYATILMDVQMPVMDGGAAARAIRALIAGLTAAAAAAGTAYIIQGYQSGQGFHPFQSDRELRNDQILFPDSDSASGLREDGDASDDSFWQEDGADDGTTPEGAQSADLFGQDQPAPEGVPSGSGSHGGSSSGGSSSGKNDSSSGGNGGSGGGSTTPSTSTPGQVVTPDPTPGYGSASKDEPAADYVPPTDAGSRDEHFAPAAADKIQQSTSYEVRFSAPFSPNLYAGEVLYRGQTGVEKSTLFQSLEAFVWEQGSDVNDYWTLDDLPQEEDDGYGKITGGSFDPFGMKVVTDFPVSIPEDQYSMTIFISCRLSLDDPWTEYTSFGLFGARFYTAEETSPARYVEGYDLSAAAIQKGGAEGVSLTEQDAHAWAEVYFDGIGWPAGCPTSSPGTIAARRPCWKRSSAAAK